MLTDDYLRYGLNALGRAHEFDYFVDGHRGGAIISGVYLCREAAVEPGVAAQVAGVIDSNWAGTALCAPFPDEAADPALVDRIVDCVRANLSGLREAGHNVILPTLALKAMRDVPDAVTPSRVDGICRMVAEFKVTQVPSSETVAVPSVTESTAFAEFVLDEFVDCVARFQGRGQGWSGHLLTYSRALLDLCDLGHADLARDALPGYTEYIRRIRLGPQEIDKPRPEHEPMAFTPLQRAYWPLRTGDLALGHQLKYPYGFYGLLARTQHVAVRRRAQQVAYRIF